MTVPGAGQVATFPDLLPLASYTVNTPIGGLTVGKFDFTNTTLPANKYTIDVPGNLTFDGLGVTTPFHRPGNNHRHWPHYYIQFWLRSGPGDVYRFRRRHPTYAGGSGLALPIT